MHCLTGRTYRTYLVGLTLLWAATAGADTSLPVKFLAQGSGNNNCGPVSLVMAASYVKGDDPTPDQVKQVNAFLGVSDQQFKSSEHLVRAGQNVFGLTLTKYHWDLADVVGELSAGRPLIVAVLASRLSNRGYNYSGDHFLVAIGYDDDHILCNDPGTRNGAARPYLRAEFDQAMKGEGGVVVAGFAGRDLPTVGKLAYNIYDLGTLPGGSESTGHGINASGQVTGYAWTAGWREEHAFLYSGGTMTDLGTLGGSNSSGWGINDSGQVTGHADTAGGATHAFLYSGGVMTDLGTLGGNLSTGWGINDSGQVTGYAEVPAELPYGGRRHVFVYSEGSGMTDLRILGGWDSTGQGINDSGQVTGSGWVMFDNMMAEDRAFLYSGGVMTNLGTLPGGEDSYGLGINDSGQVTGYAIFGRGDHAFLYSEGVMTDLGTLGGDWTRGQGINDSGQVTGWSRGDAGETEHAFLYSGGTMWDLNDLLDSGNPLNAGWTVRQGNAINDAGWITGTGDHNGHTRAFLMKPVP